MFAAELYDETGQIRATLWFPNIFCFSVSLSVFSVISVLRMIYCRCDSVILEVSFLENL